MEHGQTGLHEHSRRPQSCPWQTDAAIVQELVKLRKAHPSWGPKKLLDIMQLEGSRAAASLDTNRVPDPGEGGASAAETAVPTGPSWLSEEHPAGSERHLGGRLQGTVPAEEWELLLPAHGERSGVPVCAGVRCTSGDLAGAKFQAFHTAF